VWTWCTMKTSNMGGKSTNSPIYLELSLLLWCAVFCHGNGYKYIFISIDLICVFRWFFALIIFHNHDIVWCALWVSCILLILIWLYTAVGRPKVDFCIQIIWLKLYLNETVLDHIKGTCLHFHLVHCSSNLSFKFARKREPLVVSLQPRQ
jgi:hypothetical protein